MVHYTTCKNRSFPATLPPRPNRLKARPAMAAAYAARWKPARPPACVSCKRKGRARHYSGQTLNNATTAVCWSIREPISACFRQAPPPLPGDCSPAGSRPAKAATAAPTFSPELLRSTPFPRDISDWKAWPAHRHGSARGLPAARRPTPYSSHRNRPCRPDRS